MAKMNMILRSTHAAIKVIKAKLDRAKELYKVHYMRGFICLKMTAQLKKRERRFGGLDLKMRNFIRGSLSYTFGLVFRKPFEVQAFKALKFYFGTNLKMQIKIAKAFH